MNKKIVRKVTSTKKNISKSYKKSKFSLRSWLTGLFVLVLAIAYGMFKLQPQPLKVLEVSGTLADYIPANPVDINIVQSLKNSSIPKSDDPTAYAMAVANQYARQQVAAGKEVDPEKVKTVAKQAAREAYQDGAASGAISASEAVTAVKEKDKDGITKAEKDAEIAAEKINQLKYEKNEKGEVVITANQPATSQTVSSKGGGCSTSAFSVYEGETVIGNVSEGKNEIRACVGGSWKFVCHEGDTSSQLPGYSCSVSIKPIYQQQAEQKNGGKGGPNCYISGGSVVVGYGSVVDVEGDSGKQCQGTSNLEAVTNYKGQWMSTEKALALKEEDRKKAEEQKKKDQEACRAQGHEVRDDGTCGPASAKSCADIGKTLEGSSCVEKKETTPSPSTSGYHRTTGSTSSTTGTTGNVVNPSGKLQKGGELTSDMGDCFYGGSPLLQGGKKVAGKFVCNDYTGKLPSTNYTSFDKFNSWSACVNDSNKKSDEACVQTPDGQYSQVPDSNPNLDCTSFLLGCQWKVTSNTPEVSQKDQKTTIKNPRAGEACINGQGTDQCSIKCGGIGTYTCDNAGSACKCNQTITVTTTNANGNTSNSSSGITCPTGSTLVDNTCVADNLNPEFTKRKEGEACTNKTNCEATCDGQYIIASVKKPGNLFASNNYYCGSEEVINKILSEAGNPYTIKSTNKTPQTSLEKDPDVQARLNAGKNAAIGAVGLGGGCLAAAALVGVGTAPLAVITAPATLAICGGFTVLGGMLGAGTP